ncbi:myotubularin-related protein [Schistosoma mansoni]|uniref:phosphatidylinositol-3,5-bisphosphate 3-phosphatase n=1 Tax=Schistosoma mansoni TaxID=6183 RepID=G4VEX3_SCHMA|nr:myotubularin-related protein [Schistosoma mansoni]|eukprot:XP_018651092.1 myotubularin-related protein [Schistosoma mansoni]
MNVISMHFLPGEEPINTKSIADGIFTLTNYRLIFSTKRPQSSWSIPTTLVWKAEAFEMIHIKIITKIGISVTWSFVDEIACDAGYAHITSLIDTPRDIDSLFACKFRSSLEANIPNHPFLLSACELLQINDVDRTLDTALVCFEFRRMNFDKTWKITDINNEFKICSTYPRHHIVPRSISDNDIINMASFRSHNRFLTVVWRSQVTGAVLLRCAQPCVGLMCSRNEYDEKFLRTVLACCPKKPFSDPNKDTHRLMIVDARSRSSAQFNRIRGGGFEYPEYYDQAEVVFMDLPNLHTVRSNFEALTNLFAGKCPNWFSSLEKSSWLNNIGQLLKTASEIAIALEENARPVMVHCTDGWDRTPQISSLAQLLADPFYRTIQGFNILVEREWLQFGHKFSDRSGHVSPSLNINEQSPIFLQWLDCVHQIRNQFPHCFEFNESFLLKLGLHICSNLFGTFLCNSEKERQKASVASRTCSLWGLLSSKYNWTIVNYFYEPEAEHLLQPDCQVRSLSLWSAFYGIALSTSKVNPTLDIPQDVIEATPNNAHSVTNSTISSPTKHKSLSSIDPAPHKTDSTSNINYEESSQPTTNLLGDDHPSDSIKIMVPNLKIGTSEELNSDGDLFIKGYASSRNSHRRSLDDINNYMDSRFTKQQSREFSLSNRVSPTIMKSSSQCFFENNICNEKNSPGPAILRLSSLSDDTGICSGLSKSYIRSLSSVNNGSYPFPKHSDKCISPESDPAQLTASTCTYVNRFQQQECVLSPDENIDVFASDEQLEQNDFSFTNHNNNIDTMNSCSNNLMSSGRLYYSQFNQPIQNCQFYGKCSPLSISPRQFEFNDCDDSNHNDSVNVESHSKLPSNFNLDGVQCDNFTYNSPRWSVTTRGSNTSLYVLSDVKQSSIELLKPVSINSSQPVDIKISRRLDNPNSLIPIGSGSVYPNEFTVHSLPENDEVLVNGAVSLTSDSDDSPNECNDLNFSTPLGESVSGQVLSTNKTEISIFGHNGSEKSQDITSTISRVNEESLDEAFVTKLSELLIPEDLLAWRNKYFRSEYFSNILSQSSPSVSCGSRNPSSSQMFDCSSNNNSKALKPGGSFDSKSYSVTVNPKISLPEFTRITTNDDVYNRPTSAPISPTSAVSYFPSTLHKNSTLLHRAVHNPSIDQNISNDTNALEKIKKKPLSSTLMNTLSCFPDWDGLPMLVDRLTIHAHSQLCQERYNRKTQKQSMLALEAKLKYTQLEVERLNSEARRLKQLLELTKTQTCKQDKNTLASSDDHLSSLSSSLSSYERKLTQNSHINGQCKSKESSLLSSELFVSISKDKNISEEAHNPSNIKSELNDPIESTFLNASCKTTSFELIDTEDGQSVLLQPDCIAHQCTLCRIEFSALRPKHHCRNCGYIFCANCSDRRIVTTSQPSGPVRVCRHCFFQLSRPSVKSSKQQSIEEYTPCVARHTMVKEDNNGGGLVKNFTNPDFLNYMNNSIMLSTGSDSGCMPVSSFPDGAILRMSSSGVSHHFNGSFNSETTTNNATTTATVNHRLDSIITNNPPLSRCHSAGGARPTSSAASDGIAQA